MRKGRGLRCDGCRASMPAVQATVTATDLLCPACALAGPATPLAAHKPRAIGAEPVGPSGARGTPDDRAPVPPRAPA